MNRAVKLVAVCGALVGVTEAAGGKGQRVTTFYNECPEGYQEASKEACVKTLSKTASQKCPSGFSSGSGRHGSKEAVKCSRTTTEKPDTVCGAGFELNGKTCARTDVAPLEYYCPAGFTSTGDSCVKMVQSEFITFCEEGSLGSKGCTRVSVSSPHTVCPSGYDLSGYRCLKVTEADFERFCANGYAMSGSECTKEVSAPMIFSCPSGTRKVSDLECEKIEMSNPDRICTADETKNSCTTTVHADKVPMCPPTFDMSQLRGGDGGILCEKCQATHKATSGCEYKPAILTCPGGFTKPSAGDKTSCKRVTAVPFQQVCPHGFEESKTKGQLKCVKRTSFASTQSCPGAYTQAGGTCVAVQSQPIMKKCPKGFRTSHGKAGCKTTSVEKPEIVCAKGDLQKSKCVETFVTGVSTRCNKGYETTSKGCVKSVSAQQMSKCPKGFSFSHGKGECKNVVTESPQTVCPQGMTLQRSTFRIFSKCVETTVTAPVMFCTKGYQLVGGNCVTKVTVKPHLKSNTEWISAHKSSA